MRIGLTGGLGCGKSTVAHYFTELGIEVIDSDVIARDVVAKDTPAFDKIINHFGTKILDKNSNLDRKQLRELIFADNTERQWLENLLHPSILEVMQQRAKQAISPYCMLVIPLLLEKNLQNIVDRVLVIDAPEKLQYDRAIQRDQLTPEQFNAILQTQLTRAERLKLADDIIYNDSDLNHLKQQVFKLHEGYLKLWPSST